MKTKLLTICLSMLALSACNTSQHPKLEETKKGANTDINSVKQDFEIAILEGNVSESPYDLYYALRTVFYSKDIVSLFGEIDVNGPNQNKLLYEGRTYCRINGKLTPVTLDDLFSTPAQKDFLNKKFEDIIKEGGLEVCQPIENNYLRSFVVNENSLIAILQPTGEKCEGKTLLVNLPYDNIKDHWNSANPLAKLLPEVIQSKEYTSTWDNEDSNS